MGLSRNFRRIGMAAHNERMNQQENLFPGVPTLTAADHIRLSTKMLENLNKDTSMTKFPKELKAMRRRIKATIRTLEKFPRDAVVVSTLKSRKDGKVITKYFLYSDKKN